MIDHATIERRRAAVRKVRDAKRALSGLMTVQEIADALGVSTESLRQYAVDPTSASFRPIPEELLRKLRLLTAKMLLVASGTFVDVA